jgi:hypothetical protein
VGELNLDFLVKDLSPSSVLEGVSREAFSTSHFKEIMRWVRDGLPILVFNLLSAMIRLPR